MRSDEGLGGYRVAAGHAEHLGKVIAEVRARTHGAVWIAGHSRGSISAANAAARLGGQAAPDGVVLLSPMLVGDARARKAWVAQTVFSVDLEAIKAPLLVIGHSADNCVRSPAGLMGSVTAKTQGARQQVVTVTGGPVSPGRPQSTAACEVGDPHDFVAQEAEVAAGILRFMRGGSY
jgi:pimeloyl-ACP methyl ester carboxylesterase